MGSETRWGRVARVLAAAVLALVTGCGRSGEAEGAPEIAVYAAASLRDVLAELAPAFERELGAKLVVNLGASGDLARQIVAGAQADVFLSAGEQELDQVEAEGLVVPGTRRVFASNRLVVIEASGGAERGATHASLEGLLRLSGIDGRLAIADPDYVPAGRYAKAALEAVGAWKILEDCIVRSLDVRAAVAMVETGAADFAIVYATDLARSERARIAYPWPADSAPPITYVAGAIGGKTEAALARRFVAFLDEAPARAAFERLGFLPPSGSPDGG